MTTIATDGRSMAADGLVTSNGTVCSRHHVKIRKLADGRIVGVSGSAFCLAPFCDWLVSGGDVPELDESFDALVLQPDGKVLTYNGKGRHIPEEVPAAIGSGREIAIGAMMMGATSVQAVEVASERDMATGGTIISLSI